MAKAPRNPVALAAADKKRRRSQGPRATEMDAFVGERLRVARKLANVTQQELAAVLGISFQAVQKYENGENRITAPKLFRAAAFLGADIRFFTTPDFDRDPRREQTALGDDEIELIRHYRGIANPRTRVLLRELVRSMGEAGAAPAAAEPEDRAD